jgi:predicted nucleic acid-binding protein
MNAVDTNVLIYRLDRRDPIKRAKARSLLQQLSGDPILTLLLWQVAGELVRQLRAWQIQGQITGGTLRRYLSAFRTLFPLTMPGPNVLDQALDLADRHSLSHWDSMLLAACVEAGVDTLYTEDMGSPRQIDTVRLLNPFV